MKSLVFTSRNIKELTRDPISWVFCLGFPIVMLTLMTIINSSIPPEAGMTLFEIHNLAPAIGIFGLTFIMLFAALLVSGDRQESFLLRVFTSPMKPSDYIVGYSLPLLILSFGQFTVTIIASLILALISGAELSITGLLSAMLLSLPAMIMFIGFGLTFGTLLSKNSAPGMCSIIICLSGMVGGIWMDVDTIGGTLADICKTLPFYHCVKAVRLAASNNITDALGHTGIICIWAAVIFTIAVLVFRKKMKG